MKRRAPESLSPTQYMIKRNIYSGELTRIIGPALHFLTEEEQKVELREGRQLTQTQYAKVQNTETGVIRHVLGPTLFFPEHNECILSTESASKLSPTDYVHVRNIKSGELSVVRGPRLYIPTAEEEVVKQHSAVPLKENEYCRISDKSTGAVRVERGEALVFLQPTESVVQPPTAGVNVDVNQAALLRDMRTGQLELVTTPQVLIPAAHQELVEVRKKIRLEEYHTAVIKDNRASRRSISAPSGSGDKNLDNKQQHQIGSRQPGGRGSSMYFIKGPTSFFLEPYTEMLEQRWSSGLHKDRHDLRISLFDSRPHFMWYEFDARTKDNVELILGITLFWGLADVQRLVATTSDAAGDVCSHVRSMIIQAVSQLELEQFLASFNLCVQQAIFAPTLPMATAMPPQAPGLAATPAASTSAMATTAPAPTPAPSMGADPFGPLMQDAVQYLDSGTNSGGQGDEEKDADQGSGVKADSTGSVVTGASVDPFYTDRGISIQEIEVRSISCKDAETQRVLQEIIKENTNRISRLQHQESKNEVDEKKMQGDIRAAKMRMELLGIQQEAAVVEGTMEGQHESNRIAAFLEGLHETVPDDQAKIGLFNTLRKSDALKALSKGNASLYFTPQDVDLKIAA